MLVGGDVGPELTRIGSKVKPAWLADWLRNPKTYDPDTAMPHYRFDQKQLGPLRAFIEAKTDSDFLANVHLQPATPERVAHGKALVTERGCASCHEINGIKKPTNFAPELTVVGRLRAGFGGEKLHIGGLKGFADGSLGSTTALLFEPYLDAPNTSGLAKDRKITRLN